MPDDNPLGFLSDRLAELQTADAAQPRRVRVIEAYADNLTKLPGFEGLRFWIQPGFTTNYGQRYTLRYRADSVGYEDSLLSAYVPDQEDQPVRLDFNDEDLVACASDEELRTQIEQQLREGPIGDRLVQLAAWNQKRLTQRGGTSSR